MTFGESEPVSGNFTLVIRMIDGRRVIVHLEFLPESKQIGPPIVGRFEIGIQNRNNASDSRAVRVGRLAGLARRAQAVDWFSARRCSVRHGRRPVRPAAR